jgi:trehalose 6-phosphate synthase
MVMSEPSTSSNSESPAGSTAGSLAGSPESSPRGLVIVANRLPVTRRSSTGAWETSPGGVVSALTSVLVRAEGTWVGWSGIANDDPGSFRHDGMRLEAVCLDAEDVAACYEGMANATLWPLFHDAIRAPTIDETWWQRYVEVNERFARRTADVAPHGAQAWVHDYQLMLVPAMLRRLRPDLRIGFFLHIPFPPIELYDRLPWKADLLEGMLGADVVGMQRRGGVDNVLAAAERLLAVPVVEDAVIYDGRRVRVETHPVSIDVETILELADRPRIERDMAALRSRLGDPDVVLLGVDRLDYTKGIDARLEALYELLATGRLDPDTTVFVQIAVPSREGVEDYAEIREAIQRLVGAINGRFGRLGAPVVHYLERSLDLAQLVVLYRIADVMVVTPWRDGMNLVAKEYLASRLDGSGSLVLSEFAGAADALDEAILVNPYDTVALRDAIVAAVDMERSEMRRRMGILRDEVRTHDVHAWVQGFLDSLETTETGSLAP